MRIETTDPAMAYMVMDTLADPLRELTSVSCHCDGNSFDWVAHVANSKTIRDIYDAYQEYIDEGGDSSAVTITDTDSDSETDSDGTVKQPVQFVPITAAAFVAMD